MMRPRYLILSPFYDCFININLWIRVHLVCMFCLHSCILSYLYTVNSQTEEENDILVVFKICQKNINTVLYFMTETIVGENFVKYLNCYNNRIKYILSVGKIRKNLPLAFCLGWELRITNNICMCPHTSGLLFTDYSIKVQWSEVIIKEIIWHPHRPNSQCIHTSKSKELKSQWKLFCLL